MASKRLDAVKLAKSSRWDDLRRLVDSEPATAQQVDSYGMLPLHWACTEPQSISEGVLLALLKAFPAGARVPNTAEMLPLQIAIKAQARIEWLQALLASYPDAVLKKAMTGETAVQLARRAGLPSRSVKLLEEMYHHVCTKEGLPDQLAMDEREAQQQLGPQRQLQQQVEDEEADESKQRGLRPSERFQAIAGDVVPLPQRASGVQFGQRPRRLSSTASLKLRSFSDNDFYTQRTNAGATSTAVAGPSPWSPRRTMETVQRPPSIVSQRPSVSTRSAVSLPPRWMNAPSCSICAQKFGTFKKRHHCRNCGQSVCRDHSARERMKLPHYGLNDRHRVCVVCHDVLRNAGRQLRQQQITTQVAQRTVPLTRTSQAFESEVRRSDEAQRSPPNMLERHVSAPARASNSVAGANQGGIDDAVSEQVANLQKQVSQLIEEKQQAEMQLRVQAEMLNDPDRLTNGSRGSNTSGGSGDSIMPKSRDRQCSLPMPMHTGSVVPISYKAGQVPSSGTSTYRSSGQPLSRTRSAGCFRPTREIYIDGPHVENALPPQQARQQSSRSNPMAVNVALQRTTRLQDALNTIAAVESTYDDIDESDTDSDLEGRQTDLADFHDAEADVDAEVDDIVREYLIDDDDVDYDDDDDDEEAMVEAVKAATIATNNEIAVEGESENEVGSDTLPEVDVLVSLGHVMMEKGSVSAAVQAFTRAAEIRPDDPALHALLGRAYYADENLDDAVASITKSLSLEPSATNSTLLGKILFEKGDHEMAIAAYQRSLDMQK
uniref:FYVE-type domain-containing protein n=1 Tax=Peronospora matthiolae TaxID=2874970 RepID=A0AAV1UPR3_9STRA